MLKQHCNGCRASIQSTGDGIVEEVKCSLGYKVRITKTHKITRASLHGSRQVQEYYEKEYNPLEECPKPLRYWQLLELESEKKDIL